MSHELESDKDETENGLVESSSEESSSSDDSESVQPEFGPGPKKVKRVGRKVEDFYEVEKITDHKVDKKNKRNKLKLKVKWRGYKD